MTDEVYVRSVWVLVHRCDGSYRGYARGTVLVQDAHGHWLAFPSRAAAAEFTRDHLEQVRQLRVEITGMSFFNGLEHRDIIRYARSGEDVSHRDLVNAVRATCAWSRTTSRLEAELARLTSGIKPEALEKL